MQLISLPHGYFRLAVFIKGDRLSAIGVTRGNSVVDSGFPKLYYLISRGGTHGTIRYPHPNEPLLYRLVVNVHTTLLRLELSCPLTEQILVNGDGVLNLCLKPREQIKKLTSIVNDALIPVGEGGHSIKVRVPFEHEVGCHNCPIIRVEDDFREVVVGNRESALYFRYVRFLGCLVAEGLNELEFSPDVGALESFFCHDAAPLGLVLGG